MLAWLQRGSFGEIVRPKNGVLRDLELFGKGRYGVSFFHFIQKDFGLNIILKLSQDCSKALGACGNRRGVCPYSGLFYERELRSKRHWGEF